MDKIVVVFAGGQSRDDVHGCNYMIGHYTDSDGDEQELYAEKVFVPDVGPDEYGEYTNDVYLKAKDYGYDELKAEIIRQAKEAGISEEQFDFE